MARPRNLNETVQDSSGVGSNLGMTEIGNLGLLGGSQKNTGGMHELLNGGDGFTNPGATKPDDGIQTAGSRELTTSLNYDGGMWEAEQESKPGSPDDGFLKDMGGAGSDLGQNDKIKNTGSHIEPVSFKVAETVAAEGWDRDVIANLMEGNDVNIQDAFDGYARQCDMLCLEDFREVANAYFGMADISHNMFETLLENNREFLFDARNDAQGVYYVRTPISEAGGPSLNPFRATSDILGGGKPMGRPGMRPQPGLGDEFSGGNEFDMGGVDEFGDEFGNEVGGGDNFDSGMDDIGGDLGGMGGGTMGSAVGGALGGPAGAAVGGALGSAAGSMAGKMAGGAAGDTAMTAFHSDDEEEGFEEDGPVGMGGAAMNMGMRESLENGLDDEASADSHGYYTSDATQKGEGSITNSVKGADTHESKTAKPKDGITKDHKGMTGDLGENEKVTNKGGGWEKLTGGGSDMKENVSAMSRRAKASIQEACSQLRVPGRYKMSFDVCSPGVKPNRYMHLAEALVDLEELVQAYGIDGPHLKVNFHGNGQIVESAVVHTGTIRRRDPIIAENRVVFRRSEVARDFADQVANAGSKCLVSAHPWGAAVKGEFDWAKACSAFQSIPAQVLRSSQK